MWAPCKIEELYEPPPLASAVAADCASEIGFTTTSKEPYPAGAIVSRAPKTWIFGQLWLDSSSKGDDRSSPMRRRVGT